MNPPTKSEIHTESKRRAMDAEMAKYCITRSTVDYFHYRDFKYTNLNDALAQARREEKELCGKCS